ncbi:MAG: glycosyltransferase family 39 protein [Crocinitomicaceae bacterium]|nr:glycosyltransferase family 39 protein [Crocinitomicaceae bacterium]
MLQTKKEGTLLFSLCFLAFIVRFICWPFTQIVDADSVSRIFIASDLLEKFSIISEGVWLPLHHYLNAISIFLFSNRIDGPVFIHLLISVFTAVPLFYFTKRLFTAKGAFFAAALFLFNPLFFRNSFQVLSEIPYLFFLALTLNFISKALETKQFKHAIYAGVFATLGAGFRYEFWLMIAVFTLIFILKKQYKNAFLFTSIALLFPIYWMTGNFIAHAHFFYGVTGVYNTPDILRYNANLTNIEVLKRTLFYPFSYFFSFSPILLIGLIILFFKKIYHRSYAKIIWTLPFFAMLAFYFYKTNNGTLLLQHRFTLSLLLLSIPFTALFFSTTKNKVITTYFSVIVVVIQIPLSYCWMQLKIEKLVPSNTALHLAIQDIRVQSLSDFNAIPQIEHKEFNRISEVIVQQKSAGILLDFIDWETTYFLAITSKIPNKHIFIENVDEDSLVRLTRTAAFLKAHPKGVIQLKCGTKFDQLFEYTGKYLYLKSPEKVCLHVELMHQFLTVSTFNYRVVKKYPTHIIEQRTKSKCPKENSSDWYYQLIYFDKNWYNHIKSELPIFTMNCSKAIRENADWMVKEALKEK